MQFRLSTSMIRSPFIDENLSSSLTYQRFDELLLELCHTIIQGVPPNPPPPAEERPNQSSWLGTWIPG